MRRCGLLLSLVLVAACSDKVEGEFRIGKVDVFAPYDCINGSEVGFEGVEMWDDTGRYAHIVRFRDGPAVILYDGFGNETHRVHPEDCREFDGSLRGRSFGTRKGHLNVDCTTAVGAAFEGRVRFRGCGAIESDDDDWDDDDDGWDHDWDDC